MFERFFRRRKAQSVSAPLAHDPSQGHRDFPAALRLFRQQDWSDLTLLMAHQSVDDQILLINALGDITELDTKVADIAETPAIMTILGGVLAGWAWRHRGGGTADLVANENWDPFFSTLEASANRLGEVVELQPDNGVAWAFLARVLTGLQAGNEDLKTVETQFLGCRHRPIEGYGYLLQSRSKKWGGSHDEMFRMAQTALDDKELHPGRASIMARAHIEQWIYDCYMSDEMSNQEKQASKLDGKVKKKAIRELNETFWSLMEVDPPPEKNNAAARLAHNNLGVALTLSKDWQAVRRHVDLIGAYPAKMPWGYILGDDITTEFRDMRRNLNLAEISWPENDFSAPSPSVSDTPSDRDRTTH